MSITAPTRLPDEATAPTPVDAPELTDGAAANGHPNGNDANDYASPGHSTNVSPSKKSGNATAGTNAAAQEHSRWQIVMLPVEQIDPNPWQPRTLFDPDEMEELTRSVKAHGVQQPVIVRTAKAKERDGEYHGTEKGQAKGRPKQTPTRFELVAGERRVRASRGAGRKSIPAIVRDDLSDLQVAEMALLENVQRSNLSIIEEARGYRRLMLDFRLSEERLSKKVGKSVPVIRDMMKLLALPDGVQLLLRERKLAAAHGHELLRLVASTLVCNSVADYAVKAGLPATSLAKDPLPNARDLEKRGLLAPIDYRTRFDKAQCKSCPHKAHVASGYVGYCLLPDEWKRKQDEVTLREKDEAARTLEEARRQSETRTHGTSEGEGGEAENGEVIDAALPLLSQLPRASYKDLRFGEVPPACTGACPCRGCALDPHASTDGKEEDGPSTGTGTRVAICLDPARYGELQKAERGRRAQERERHFTQRLGQALHVVRDAWQQGRSAQFVAIAFTPFLDGRSPRGAYLAPGQWQMLLERAALQMELDVPLERLFDEDTDDSEVLRLLAGQDTLGEQETPDPLRLLLLGASGLLALEAHSAAQWGGETPLLDFVLPPDAGAQASLDLEPCAAMDGDGEEETDDDEDEDPFMEEDFTAVLPIGHESQTENTDSEENG